MSKFNILTASKIEQFMQNEAKMSDIEQLIIAIGKYLRGNPVLSKLSFDRGAVCIKWGLYTLEFRYYGDYIESVLRVDNTFCNEPTTGYRDIVRKFFEEGLELVAEISAEILRMDSYFLRHGGCIVEGDETDEEN